MFRLLTLLLLFAALASPQSDLRRTFERARLLEERNTNLNEAIRLYAEVAERGKGQRSLAARALYQLGVLYARTRRASEATRVWRVLIQDYPEQTEVVQLARAKLNPSGSKMNGPVNRRVTDGDLTTRPSPDGRLLVFTDWQTGNLAVRDLATGEQRALTTKRESWQQSRAQALGAVFSPDGRKIAYQWHRGDLTVQIRSISVDGTGDRVLFEDNAAWDCLPLDWSADGTRILVRRYLKDRTEALAAIAADDGKITGYNTRDASNIGTALLARDSRGLIVTVSRDSQPGDISYLDAAGRDVPLVRHPANDFAIGFLPDGRLLFGSDRLGSVDLWALRLAGNAPDGAPEVLLRHANIRRPLGMTQNGSLFYLLDTSVMDVYLAALDVARGVVVEAPRVVSHRNMGDHIYPRWSPDGDRLLFRARGRNGRSLPLIYSHRTGAMAEVTPDLKSFGRPLWDPDGVSVFVFGADATGKQGNYRLDVANGKSTLVFPYEETGSIFEGAWSLDGRFYFNRPDDWRLGIYRMDARTREKKILYVPPAGVSIGKENLAPSPDGRLLAFHAAGLPANGSSLMIAPVEGGEAKPLMSISHPEEFAFGAFTWTQDSKCILASRGVEGKHEIWRVPVDGGAPFKIGMTMPRIATLGLNRDGKTIAFHSGQDNSEIWVLEKFLR